MMTETVEKIAEYSADQIVGRVAAALEDAAKTYGPDAVDLALTAYRVHAVQSLIEGAALLASVVAIIKLFLWLWRAREDMDEGIFIPLVAIGGFVSAILALFSIATALDKLIDAPAWLAAFGHPEIMIATKALAAAGLM